MAMGILQRKNRRARSSEYPIKEKQEDSKRWVLQDKWERERLVAIDISKRWNRKSSERGTQDQVCCKAWKQATQRARLQVTMLTKQAALSRHPSTVKS